MSSRNLMPRGGFFRGVLAAITLGSLIVIALSTAFMPDTERRVVPTLTEEPSITEPSIKIVTPSDPQTVAPVFGAPQTAPAAIAAPKISEPAGASIDVPASQAAPATPRATDSTLKTRPAGDLTTAANTDSISTQSAPVPVTSAPVEQAPDPVAVVEAKTESSVIAAPVPAESSGFTATTTSSMGGPVTDESGQTTLIAGSAKSESNPFNDAATQVGLTAAGASGAPAKAQTAPKPSIGLEMAGQTIIAPSVDETAAVVPVDQSRGAFLDNSMQYTAPADTPEIAIILVASSLDQAAATAKLAAPITLAVGADVTDAAGIVAEYRTAGGEVMLYVPDTGSDSIKTGSDPKQTAKRLSELLKSTPGVTGLVDGPDGKMPGDSRLLGEVVKMLDVGGYGIVTTNGIGRNRAEVMASEAGIPVTSIALAIDTDQGTFAIIRALDQAVLTLGAHDNITVFGHAGTRVITEVNFWLNSDKAQAVTVVPVSALMLGK